MSKKDLRYRPIWTRTAYNKVCVECGNPYTCHQKRQEFCSRNCLGKHTMRNRRSVRQPRPQPPKICQHCGATFFVKGQYQFTHRKYCSHVCSSKAAWLNLNGKLRQNLAAKAMRSRVCIVCGNRITNSHLNTICCSRKCAVLHRRTFKPYEVTCVNCGKQFISHQTGERQRFCSRSCVSTFTGKRRWNKIHAQFPPLEHTCLCCGKRFVDKNRPYTPVINFCSRTCVSKYQWITPNSKTRQASGSAHKRERSRQAILKRRFHLKDTPIELAIQHELRKRGIKFVKQIPLIVCQPDFFIPEARLAVFCDGCYWHGCSEHRPAGLSAKQRKWVEEDKYKTAFLLRHGYNVLRFWEHDINKNVVACVDKIVNLIASKVDVAPTNGNLSIRPDISRKST